MKRPSIAAFADLIAADRTFWLAPTTKPKQAVQGIKQALRKGAYAAALRKIFEPRLGADGNYFTVAHGLLVRLAFRGFVTTNYDRGLIAAQQKLRPDIPLGVSFATWKDHDSVHRWLNGTIFREASEPDPVCSWNLRAERHDRAGNRRIQASLQQWALSPAV